MYDLVCETLRTCRLPSASLRRRLLQCPLATLEEKWQPGAGRDPGQGTRPLLVRWMQPAEVMQRPVRHPLRPASAEAGACAHQRPRARRAARRERTQAVRDLQAVAGPRPVRSTRPHSRRPDELVPQMPEKQNRRPAVRNIAGGLRAARVDSERRLRNLRWPERELQVSGCRPRSQVLPRRAVVRQLRTWPALLELQHGYRALQGGPDPTQGGCRLPDLAWGGR